MFKVKYNLKFLPCLSKHDAVKYEGVELKLHKFLILILDLIDFSVVHPVAESLCRFEN